MVLLAALMLPASARAQEPYFDVRDQARPVAPRVATRALERRLGDQAVVDVDPTTRTPRMLARLDGTLSGPASGAAADIALDYVRDHLDALGLDADALDTLQSPRVATHGGIRAVRWRQAVNGVAAADSELRVNVTADGRVLSVLGSPAASLPSDTTPDLSAGEAVRAVQDDVGAYRPLVRRKGIRNVIYDDGTNAELTLFAQRLSWRVTYRAASDAVYDVMVDADTGKVLRRVNMVKSDALVWDNHPDAAYGGHERYVSLAPWLTSATALEGPWVHVWTDLDDDNRVGAGEEVAPGVYPLTPFTGQGCDSVRCSWSGSGSSWTTNRKQNAVQAFYLANRYRDHLAQAPISFNGFEGDDKVLLQTDDGASTGPDVEHINNGNMLTPRDGQSPTLQIYLWGPPRHRAVNGGDDASILYHEYTHGLTNRLVTDADGGGALNSEQAGAMGEGFSDFYAKDFIIKEFPELDTATPGEVDMGVYMDRPGIHATRTEALDCPVGASAARCPGTSGGGSGGYTYGDFGKIFGSPEVHADGEIWAQTLWDLRSAIGSDEAERVITAALPLSPPEPSYLDMRNAILLADGGPHRDAIWSVFANRGMGFYASTIDSNDTQPVEDNSRPPTESTPRGTIAGTITDSQSHRPVAGVTVSVGGLTDGPDALTATTDAAGHYEIPRVPAHTYASVLVAGPGFERNVVSGLMVTADTKATLNTTVRRDWAARSGGARIASTDGDEYADLGCGPNAAIDADQTTAWSTDYTGQPKEMVVELPQPVDVTAVGIDPTGGCGDDSSASMADYTVQTSATGDTFDELTSGTFTIADQRRLKVVSTAANNVRFVKLIAKSPQVSGSDFVDVTEFAVYGTAHVGAPDTTIAPSPPVDSDPTPTFTFSSDLPGSAFECSLDGANAAACTSPYTTPPLTDGRHTLTVTAINVNGVRDPSPVTWTWEVDLDLPDTQITGRPGPVTNEATPTFTFAGGTSYRCRWDGGDSIDCPPAPLLSDGPHHLEVWARNAVGDDPTPATYDFIVDTVKPAVKVDVASVDGDAARFELSVNEPATLTCSFTAQPTKTCTALQTYTRLADGTYTFTVIARDAAGNTSKPVSKTVPVGLTVYDTTVTAPALVGAAGADVAFSSPAADARFECALDGAAFTACTSPTTLTGLSEGAHTFLVRASGPSGHPDATPARADFIADLTPPDTSIASPAPGAVFATRDIPLRFDASEPATFLCRLDGADIPCTGILGGLADGGHSITVTAVDAAGNADPSPAASDFSVTMPPAATPTPTPTPTTSPRRALDGVTIVKTVSLKSLRKQRRLRFSVRTAPGAHVTAEAKLGSKRLGGGTRIGTGSISLKLDKKKLRAAHTAATLSVRVQATGTGLTPVTQTLKVKLNT